MLLDILEESHGTLEFPAIDGLGGLAGVLEGDAEVGTAGAGRLGGFDLSRSVSHLLSQAMSAFPISFCHKFSFISYVDMRVVRMWGGSGTRIVQLGFTIKIPDQRIMNSFENPGNDFSLSHRKGRGNHSPSRRLEVCDDGVRFDDVVSAG